MEEAQRAPGGSSNALLTGVLSSPVFQPRDSSSASVEAAKLARKRVADQFEERLKAMEVAGKMMQRLGIAAFGNDTDSTGAMLSTAADLARGMGSADLKLILMAHMQGRFARGMQAETSADVFTASVTTANCTKPDVAKPTLLNPLHK